MPRAVNSTAKRNARHLSGSLATKFKVKKGKEKKKNFFPLLLFLRESRISGYLVGHFIMMASLKGKVENDKGSFGNAAEEGPGS